jgi:integrase
MSRARFQDPPLQTAGKGKDAFYFVRFRVYREDGTSVRKRVTIALKNELSNREATKKKQEIIARETSQVPKMLSGGGVVTLQKFYEERFLVMKSSWSEPHRESFQYIMTKFVLPQFGNMAIDAIDKVQIQARLNTLAKDYSKSTLKHVRTKLVEVFEEAIEQDFVSKNPAKKTAIPLEARKPHQPKLTAEELILLIDKLTDARDKALFLVGTFCALRTSEAFGLPWKNFRYDAKTDSHYFLIDQIVYRGKRYDRTKNEASKAKVHIGPRTLKAVMQWQKECKDTSDDALMFPSTNLNGRAKKGAPMFPGTWLQKRLQPIAKELGIGFKVNFRATRRTAATLIQDQGSSLASAQAVLRHASSSTTAEVYTKPVTESVRKAVNDYEDLVFAARAKPVRVK